jgi:hypothetical protein
MRFCGRDHRGQTIDIRTHTTDPARRMCPSLNLIRWSSAVRDFFNRSTAAYATYSREFHFAVFRKRGEHESELCLRVSVNHVPARTEPIREIVA